VMRDLADNVGDHLQHRESRYPMGLTHGDSITVAPAQTLTTAETSACGTSRIAINPRDRALKPAQQHSSSRSTPANGRCVVIEMNLG